MCYGQKEFIFSNNQEAMEKDPNWKKKKNGGIFHSEKWNTGGRYRVIIV